MRRIFFLWLLPLALMGQSKYEYQELTGIVRAIEPGFNFAYQYLYLEVNGERSGYMFNPEYGALLHQRITPGDRITFRARLDLRSREWRKKMEASNRPLPWYMFMDVITEIKLEDQWLVLSEWKGTDGNPESGVFINKMVVGAYKLDGLSSALLFEGGIVATYLGSYLYPGAINTIKIGDRVSFGGQKMNPSEGFKYPVEPVRGVYYFNRLNHHTGTLYSYLFKQNSVCIGVRFNLADGKRLDVSFPSEEAIRVKEYLANHKDELQIYCSDYKPEGQLHPVELHALVSPGDTLFITNFGFYGGADGKHDHQPVDINGKITRVNVTPKGAVSSLIVNGDYYIEIDAMMAQQLTRYFQKGKSITIQGKQRIKKQGEIYQKNYNIVMPERLTIDGKTFSVYEP